MKIIDAKELNIILATACMLLGFMFYTSREHVKEQKKIISEQHDRNLDLIQENYRLKSDSIGMDFEVKMLKVK